MALFLIRHPRPLVDEGICYGRSNLALAEDLRECVPKLQTELPVRYRLFSSPLRRCTELAQALDQRVIYDTRLAEMDFGEWELQPWTRIGAETLDRWIASGYHNELHGGESLAGFRARVLDWAHSLGPQDEQVAVTHAGVIRILLAHVRGLPLHDCLQLPVPFSSVTRLNLPIRAGGEP